MKVKLITPPSLEPIDLSSLKLHLRLDSGSFADNIDETQSIAPGSHAISAGGAYTHVGAAVEVLGYTAVVVFNAGILTVGGVVDVKIQESDDNTTWTDWATGAFTQHTISATAATQEKAYTGTKRYIRTVAKVITQAAEFSTTVIRLTATSVEDDLLNDWIKTARLQVENDSRRQLITATWDYFLQEWPSEDRIKLPFGNLQSITSIKWKNTTGTETTLTANTDYLVETNGDQCGFVVLPYGETWPTGTLYPSNPIAIRFVCGYGSLASDVPSNAKSAMKLFCGDLYQNRESQSVGSAQIYFENTAYKKLINSIPRLLDEF